MPFGPRTIDNLQLAGLTNYHNGLAAEGAVADHYARRGVEIVEDRWRGKAGEIDLICRDGDGYIFVEVKRARTFARAAERLSHRQLERIMLAAEEYVGTRYPGKMINMRIDLAIVDGTGQIETLENISLF